MKGTDKTMSPPLHVAAHMHTVFMKFKAVQMTDSMKQGISQKYF